MCLRQTFSGRETVPSFDKRVVEYVPVMAADLGCFGVVESTRMGSTCWSFVPTMASVWSNPTSKQRHNTRCHGDILTQSIGTNFIIIVRWTSLKFVHLTCTCYSADYDRLLSITRLGYTPKSYTRPNKKESLTSAPPRCNIQRKLKNFPRFLKMLKRLFRKQPLLPLGERPPRTSQVQWDDSCYQNKACCSCWIQARNPSRCSRATRSKVQQTDVPMNTGNRTVTTFRLQESQTASEECMRTSRKPSVQHRVEQHGQRQADREIGETLLRTIFKKEHCCHLSLQQHWTSAYHGWARCWILEFCKAINNCTWQLRYPLRLQMLQKHPPAPPTQFPLSVLERASGATG